MSEWLLLFFTMFVAFPVPVSCNNVYENVLRKWAEEMNEAKCRVRMVSTESTMEGPGTMMSEELEDLPEPIGVEEDYSSHEEGLRDGDDEG